MKKFVAPVVEIEKFELCDVITTSVCGDDVQGCPNDLGL